MVFKSSTNSGGGGGGGVSSVTGTTNRITSSGGTTPVIDIAATYVGQATITTLGTIGTGVWQGTAVAVGFGGTGLASGTSGGIPYYSATNTMASSAALTANAIIKGGGAGVAPSASGVSIDASNNVSGIGTLAAGATAITSSSANALAVGRQGATNPALQIDASAATTVNGVKITPSSSGNGIEINAISSAANEQLRLNSLGSGIMALNTSTGTVNLQVGGNNRYVAAASSHTFSVANTGTAATVRFGFTGNADTALTASTEAPNAYFNLGQTRQHNTGALTLQRDFRISGSDHSFVGASALTDHVILGLDFSTGASTNATITNTSALYVPTAVLTGTKTNSYGLNITAASGATNNYAARLAGSAGEIFRVRTDGQVALLATNTPAGTTGAQVINRPSGTVNFAAAATSLVVTNSLVTTSSIVFATVRTNDSTAVIKNVVPGAGSFTINLGAAATAETSVGFVVFN